MVFSLNFHTSASSLIFRTLALTGHVAEEKKAEEAKTSKRVKEKK
jgi:hypothetical protein